MWFTSRACGLPGLAGAFNNELGPNADLIFEIEFCPTTQTPTMRKTWGSLKTTYR